MMFKSDKYKTIVSHYEDCFRLHGDTVKGMDWPNLEDLVRRYTVMLELIRDEDQRVSLLDFGCGTAMLKAHIDARRHDVDYCGLDLSEAYIQHCRRKFPETPFLLLDVLENAEALGGYDYVVMNGVLTEKRSMTFDEMFGYMSALLKVLFARTRRGLAFNVMSKAVDWERDDLFHVPTEPLIQFLVQEISRHFVIRHDYGLYEYTVYVYRTPFGDVMR